MAAAALNDDSTIGRTIEFNNGDLPIAEVLAASGDRKRGRGDRQRGRGDRKRGAAGRSGSPPSIG